MKNLWLKYNFSVRSSGTEIWAQSNGHFWKMANFKNIKIVTLGQTKSLVSIRLYGIKWQTMASKPTCTTELFAHVMMDSEAGVSSACWEAINGLCLNHPWTHTLAFQTAQALGSNELDMPATRWAKPFHFPLFELKLPPSSLKRCPLVPASWDLVRKSTFHLSIPYTSPFILPLSSYCSQVLIFLLFTLSGNHILLIILVALINPF